MLPDGSCSSITLRPGSFIREVLQDLCQSIGVNIAAVDLFLVGGEKVGWGKQKSVERPLSACFVTVEQLLFIPAFSCHKIEGGLKRNQIVCSLSRPQPLVLDQDCMTLCSRELRLEKRTLFRYQGFTNESFCLCSGFKSTLIFFSLFAAPRLDLVPINRSVGLKAKPTKPVTEVLRPVVAKYGLHLGDLVAKIVSHPLWPLMPSCVLVLRAACEVCDGVTGWSIMVRGGKQPHPFPSPRCG